jgi:polar amino acid transport system permease protein
MDFISLWQHLQADIPLLGAVHFTMIWEYRGLFISGFFMTIALTLFAVVFGTVIGLFTGMARLAESKHRFSSFFIRCFLRIPSTLYVTFFRGTPLFVQIPLIHFALMPLLIHETSGLLISGEFARELRQNYGAFISGLTALTLNAGAYITEIFRGGIQSISKGQMAAGRSLGMTYSQCMRYIIIPQAFRRMLPPLGNETITLLKDSSLVSAIGFAELAYAARTVAGANLRYWEPYLTISLVYLILTIALAYGVSYLEKHFQHHGGIQ